MTKTLIEALQELQTFNRHAVEVENGAFILADDLRAIIEQYKTEGVEPVAYADPQAFVNFKNSEFLEKEWMWSRPDSGLVPLFTSNNPSPAIVGELVKALEDILYSAKYFPSNAKRLGDIAESALARAKAMTE